MKRSRSEANVMRRWYRTVEHECPDCHRTLRAVITLGGGIRLIGVCGQEDQEIGRARRTNRPLKAPKRSRHRCSRFLRGVEESALPLVHVVLTVTTAEPDEQKSSSCFFLCSRKAFFE
jgi:hypothetical protein